MSLLTLLMVPAILALVIYLLDKDNTITLNEFLIQIGVQSILIAGIYAGSLFASLSDMEIWNGRVTSKNSAVVPCLHAYPCNCHSETDSDGNSSTSCDVCFQHPFDKDWLVHDTAGVTFSIDHEDPQGLIEPSDYTKVQMGETTASRHSYTNYVKNSKSSLFRKGAFGTNYSFSEYPVSIWDYFKIDRLVDPDKVVKDPERWNLDISSVAADLGVQKQINLVIHLSKNKPDDFFNGLEYKWAGAKKNDVVAVINVDDKGTIVWADVMAMVKDEYFKVKLRDDLVALKTLDRAAVIQTIRTDVQQYYVRRPMKDFKYLLHATKVSFWYYVMAFVLSVAVSLWLSKYMSENDVA